MTPADIEKAIIVEFNQRSDRPFVTAIGKLVLTVNADIDPDSLPENYSNRKMVLDDIKYRLKEQLMRMIYEDQRKQMFDALNEASQYPMGPLLRDRLMALARQQESRTFMGDLQCVTKPCVWTQNETGQYETQCRTAFEFTNDGIKENGFKYCPFCGCVIKKR